jgi:hypothetical protein
MAIKAERRENKYPLLATYEYNIQQVITYGQQNCKNYMWVGCAEWGCEVFVLQQLLDCSSIQLSSLILFHENSLFIHTSNDIMEGHFFRIYYSSTLQKY